MLEKNEISKKLYSYYKEVYGELETDQWFEQPAINVWVFGRDEKIVTLKCLVLTGVVKSKEETKSVV